MPENEPKVETLIDNTPEIPCGCQQERHQAEVYRTECARLSSILLGIGGGCEMLMEAIHTGQLSNAKSLTREIQRHAESNATEAPRCFLLEDDPPEQHGKPIACTQCWNALGTEVDELREDLTTLLVALGRIAGMEIDSPGTDAIDIALETLAKFGLTERGENLKAEAAWKRFTSAGKGEG